MKKKEKIEEKYFEDIFYPIKDLWKGTYYLPNTKNTETYVESIGNDYDKVDDITLFKNKSKYNEWDLMMVFTMYGTLIDTGLKYIELGVDMLDIKDIPIEDFERDYLSNLKEEGNEEYLEKYKGLKSRVDKPSSK